MSLRRLTHSQYNHTVRDLLGDSSLPASQFPPEDFVNGFKNQYASQNLSPLVEDAYGAAGKKLAKWAFRNSGSHGLLACQPSPACRTEFIRSFGLKAFRRPGSHGTAAHYEALFRRSRRFSREQLVTEAMLQSPLPVPAGRHQQPEMASLCRRQPALVRALGQHARRCADGCRSGRFGHPAEIGENRAPDARRSQGERGA